MQNHINLYSQPRLRYLMIGLALLFVLAGLAVTVQATQAEKSAGEAMQISPIHPTFPLLDEYGDNVLDSSGAVFPSRAVNKNRQVLGVGNTIKQSLQLGQITRSIIAVGLIRYSYISASERKSQMVWVRFKQVETHPNGFDTQRMQILKICISCPGQITASIEQTMFHTRPILSTMPVLGLNNIKQYPHCQIRR